MMNRFAQVSDFISGFALLGLLLELLYLNRRREEFALNAVYWLFILLLLATAPPFLISAFNPETLAPYMPTIRLATLAEDEAMVRSYVGMWV